MYQFFQDNMLIFRVIYTILFFIMSFAVSLKLNRQSGLRLARSLWLLTGYGYSQGLNELCEIFIRVKGPQLLQPYMFGINTIQLALKALSYLFIMWLGLCLLSDSRVQLRFFKKVGFLVNTIWVILALLFIFSSGTPRSFAHFENMYRYLFAFPGFLLAGIGLLMQVREVSAFQIRSLIINLKGLAVTFFCASFIVGLIASEPVRWPSTVLNRQTFMEITGIPAILLRSCMLVLFTYFMVRIVDVFEVEREQRLEEALRQQVLLDERERIARELHDGIIQSIYGVGLKLEQALILGDKRQEDAKRQLSSAKNDLNHVIQDIRDYIQELQPAEFSCVSLLEGINHLLDDFQENALMKFSLTVDGKQTSEMNIIQTNNILQVLRELLTNAVKHSHAKLVEVAVIFTSDGVKLRVSDDGVGFDPTAINQDCSRRDKQGLGNVFYRVGMLQGLISFHSARGQGSIFEVSFPYQKMIYPGGIFVKDKSHFQIFNS